MQIKIQPIFAKESNRLIFILSLSFLFLVDYEIRLNGSSDTPYQGKVEVSIGGMWFAVDEREWDIRDGNVACRQLGYAGAYGVTIADSSSSQKGFTNLRCQGNETSLQQCNHTKMQFSSYSRDAAVTCYGKSFNDIFLV